MINYILVKTNFVNLFTKKNIMRNLFPITLVILLFLYSNKNYAQNIDSTKIDTASTLIVAENQDAEIAYNSGVALFEKKTIQSSN